MAIDLIVLYVELEPLVEGVQRRQMELKGVRWS